MKNWNENIETNPNILYGKPVIKGTRIPVDLLLDKMSNRQKFQDIIQNYHDLEEDECRDPKDNKFLELAVAGNADCIVTGDKDLLELHPFRNIRIITPKEFLTQFNI